MKEILVNRIPRPTFRYLRVNETPMALREPTRLGEITFSDRTYVTESGSLRTDFTGASEDIVGMGRKGKTYTIDIPAGEEATLIATIHTDETHPDFAGNILIHVGAKGKLQMIWRLEGPMQEGVLVVSADYVVEEDGQIQVSRIVQGLRKATICDQRNIHIAKDGKAHFAAGELGGERLIVHSYAKLEGQRSELKEKAFYAADGEQILDLYYHADHYGEDSDSHIDVKGALFDRAKKTFRGTIDFKRGCAGAVGDEADYAIQLSPKTKNISLPLLLCTEDNVQGNHASSAGQLDPATVYFLMSRGFSEEEARRIVVESLIRPLVDALDPSLQEESIEAVRHKLGAKEMTHEA